MADSVTAYRETIDGIISYLKQKRNMYTEFTGERIAYQEAIEAILENCEQFQEEE